MGRWDMRLESVREAWEKYYLVGEVSYSSTSHHLYLGIFHADLSAHRRRKVYLSTILLSHHTHSNTITAYY